MDRKYPNFKDKINAISSYFNVSVPSAKYIYHRRKKGQPFKNESDVGYMQWDMKIQNSLIKADLIKEFDWKNLKFINDVTTLNNFGIDVESQDDKLYTNKKENDFNESNELGWTVVTRRRSNKNKKILTKLHLI